MPNVAVVSIYVLDMDASVAFYRDVLQFKVQARPMPSIALLESDGVGVVLCQATERASSKYRDSTGFVLGLAEPDVASATKSLRLLGVQFIQEEPVQFPAGQYITIADPSGNPIELLQFNK